ncbi:hypothetical protein THRCLA_00703, partial [Thraustotheca clavata]
CQIRKSMEKKAPSDFLKSVLGRPVDVKLNNGVEYKGILACLDGFMNIAMEQTQEYVNGQLKAQYGDCFIRGNNGILVHFRIQVDLLDFNMQSTYRVCLASFIQMPFLPAEVSCPVAHLKMLKAVRGKAVQSRFDLLLLEDGEYFLDDFSAFRYPDPVFTCLTFHHCKQRKVQGRLKLCTRSFMFEPQDSTLPILKFPYRDMPHTPAGEIFEEANKQVYLSFECTTVVEMKERGLDHPYVTKNLADSSVASTKFIFSFAHSKVHDIIDAAAPLWSLANTKSILNKIDEESKLAPILGPRHTDVFDPSLLADFRERPLLQRGKVVNRIAPLLKYPGTLMLTNLRVYFQPAQVNNTGDPVVNFAYTKVTTIHKRRHMLKQCGLEITLDDKSSHFYSFETMKDRDEIYDLLIKQPGVDQVQEHNSHLIPEMLEKWQTKQISNFEYLSFLNDQAGRTVNDLTQYPVFPWVVADYTSARLDLSNPATFRDLSKPVGALNPDRLAYFQQRYQAMPSGMEAEGLPPPFLYGTHYSTPGYVLFYLVRLAPEYMLCLQNGKFDAADRLFKSIAGTWQSCLTNHADLKELIPAFYDPQGAEDWLLNLKNLDLGTTQQLERVGDVELPPWAESPKDFVLKLRAALESDYVSAHLHEWIDLIFGYKQQGAEAVAANNLFYYLSYEGSVNLETITDPVEKCSFEAQIQEFGQTPKLLFLSPHPARSEVDKSPVIAPLEPIVLAPLPPATEDIPPPSPSSSPEKDTPTNTARRSMFGFSRPTLSGLGLNVNGLNGLNGLKASIRKRMERRNWGWSFDGQSPASGNLWDESLPHYFHSKELTSCVLSKDAKYVFSTSRDGTFKLSSCADGVVKRSYSCGGAALACDLSPDEKYAVFTSSDLRVYMFALETGRVSKLDNAHDSPITGISVIDDSRFLTCSDDGVLKLWQYGPVGMLSSPLFAFEDCDAAITCLDVNSEGTLAIVGRINGAVDIYDLRTNSQIIKVCVSQCQAEVLSVNFDRAGNTFVCATDANELVVCTSEGVESTRLAIPIKDDAIQYVSTHRSFPTLSFRCMVSDGTYAITGSANGGIYIWQLHTDSQEPEKKCIVSIGHAHKRPISTITVSSNGHTVLSGAADGSVRVWTLKKKAPRARLGYFA